MGVTLSFPKGFVARDFEDSPGFDEQAAFFPPECNREIALTEHPWFAAISARR
jgi:hypothetical protein